uniref:Factor inhibiting HIF n=2 Tax=Strongylocentrotus purpuratus TaxID=7668 RepID=A0A221C9G0_STRPU|nr:factor inhibiting HIF [Strongylocentrotus purpuratus]
MASSASECGTSKADQNTKCRIDLDPLQHRKYTFPSEQIPRLDVSDPKVSEYVRDGKPVVITGTNLVETALKWDLDYLEKNLGSGKFNVYVSKNHHFMYFDDKKASNQKEFSPKTRLMEMTIPEFVQLMEEKKGGTDKVYLQQALNDSVGPSIVEDFVRFNWNWVTDYQKKNSWGPLTSNLLLVSMEGNVTPAHYDEQENFFAQVKGYKRFIMFPPSQFDRLYPFPVHHPNDRQSQVNFDDPDFERFPKFRNAKAVEAVVGPGDVIYIPMYWWHHVESLLHGGVTVSVTFWFKAGAGPKQVEYPLTPQQKVSITRNIEKMLFEVLKDPKEVASLFHLIVDGRYDLPADPMPPSS